MPKVTIDLQGDWAAARRIRMDMPKELNRLSLTELHRIVQAHGADVVMEAIASLALDHNGECVHCHEPALTIEEHGPLCPLRSHHARLLQQSMVFAAGWIAAKKDQDLDWEPSKDDGPLITAAFDNWRKHEDDKPH